MKKEHLLVDCKLEAIRKRLETTLANIQFQRGVMIWDDEEKIEHCIEALKIMESNKTDLSIRIVDNLVKEGLVVDCIDTDNETEFEFQDSINETLNKEL